VDYIYDTEIFPNCFLLNAVEATTGHCESFEISNYYNDSDALRSWLIKLKATSSRMIGFNNLAFDYPLLHAFLAGCNTAPLLYEKAQAIIDSEDKFAHMVWPSDRHIPQIDLLKIHHFDNVARMTSLKTLEFNMRMMNISDLPFEIGQMLNREQINTLRTYCWNDIDATKAFYEVSKEKIHFREQLSEKYQRDFMNHSDVKIGKEIFQISLEASGVQCYDYSPGTGRTPRQTQRPQIRLADCVPDYVHFGTNFEDIRSHFQHTTISHTKGVFDNLTVTVGGLEFKFGTGGLHASVDKASFVADDEMMIYDVDVTSLYPSVAIENNYYPAHLGSRFVEVYRQLREQRVGYKKGTPENAMLKLALNGVYGASNDKFSIFFDPRFTMQVTISGQLLIAMLAEQLLTVPGIKTIQCNTDGITLYLPRSKKHTVDYVCGQWEKHTKLSLEHVEYSRMYVADVNSYLAVKLDGSVKRKGRYEYELDWHKDHSALVVPKVAEKFILEGGNIMDYLRNWPDRMDFMLRAKVNRGSRLVAHSDGVDHPMERTQRYYIAEGGVDLVKIMPPTAKKPNEYRRFAIQQGWKVFCCNTIMPDFICPPVDLRWYANEVEKLVYPII
jgi:hypothetical protein